MQKANEVSIATVGAPKSGKSNLLRAYELGQGLELDYEKENHVGVEHKSFAEKEIQGEKYNIRVADVSALALGYDHEGKAQADRGSVQAINNADAVIFSFDGTQAIVGYEQAIDLYTDLVRDGVSFDDKPVVMAATKMDLMQGGMKEIREFDSLTARARGEANMGFASTSALDNKGIQEVISDTAQVAVAQKRAMSVGSKQDNQAAPQEKEAANRKGFVREGLKKIGRRQRRQERQQDDAPENLRQSRNDL